MKVTLKNKDTNLKVVILYWIIITIIINPFMKNRRNLVKNEYLTIDMLHINQMG